MSKPILWLGPVEELDRDYDPLLGRSAMQPETRTGTTASKAPLDPSRSVFDDPADLIVHPPVSPPPILETTTIVKPPPVLVVEADETTLKAVADQAQPDPVEPIDFEHNNNPIPERGDREVFEQDPFSFDHDDEMESLAPAPKKSFFANLFSKRETTPSEANSGASINEIWAKADAKPEPEPEPEAEAEAEAEITAEQEPEPSSSIEPSEAAHIVVDAEPNAAIEDTSARDKWAAINRGEEIDVVIEQVVTPERVIEAVVELEPAEAIVEVEPEIVSMEASLEPQIEREPSDDETVDPQQVPDEIEAETADLETAISDATEIEDADAIGATDEAKPELEVPETIPEPALESKPETVTPSPFQSAFNADKFWSVPSSQKQPAPDKVQPQKEEEALAPDLVEIGATEEAQAEPTIDNTPIAALTPPVPPNATQRVRPAGTRKKRKKKVKKNYVGAFIGTSLFTASLVMTFVSALAAFGYPFDMLSSYRWYWIILAVLSAATWGLSRGWLMVGASFLVMAVNLFVTVPASGKAPTGGKTATAVIGWANVAGNTDALARVFKDADKKQATLLMLAEAPQGVFTPPAGWTLIEAPVAGDPTAIAVLSKGSWRAATLPGEPTMARPPAGDLTVIGVHPQDAQKGRRRTPMRDALINRAGTRAGIQDGPTIVLGDFSAAAWDHAMKQFTDYGNVTRVRCGGWTGTTFTQAFGLIGVATDHAFVRDVKVTHCKLGGALSGGNHKPIWLYVAPQIPAAVPAQP